MRNRGGWRGIPLGILVKYLGGERWFSRCFVHRAHPSSPCIRLCHTADVAEAKSGEILGVESILAGKTGSIPANAAPRHPRIPEPPTQLLGVQVWQQRPETGRWYLPRNGVKTSSFGPELLIHVGT